MNAAFVSAERRLRSRRRGGFTLIELLVVIAIITLLIGILVPALAKAREQAKRVSIRANFDGIGKGLEMFKTELSGEAQGESYPSSHPRPPHAPVMGAGSPDPSFGDDPTEPGLQRLSGAQWLVRYLFGKDSEGYVPKKNVPRSLLDAAAMPGADPYYGQQGQNSAGSWYSNFQASNGTSAPLARAPLYLPSAGRNLRKLPDLRGGPSDENTPPPSCTQVPSDASTNRQPVLVDSYDSPILYYSADVRYGQSANANLATSDASYKGIFHFSDNALFTGFAASHPGDNTAPILPSWDLGGPQPLHPLGQFGEFTAASPPGAAAITTLIQDSYEATFAGVIWNRPLFRATGGMDPSGNLRGRVAPYRKDSFLLISPGPDGLYGTKDDVTNFD